MALDTRRTVLLQRNAIESFDANQIETAGSFSVARTVIMKSLSLKFRAALWLGLLAAGSLFAQETQVQYLSGHGKDDAVPWRFMCTSGANSGYWTNLPVPSQWDVLGFGSLNYSKDPEEAREECGLYEHTFTVPANWSTQRVFLVFEGSMTDTSAKLNGESVGPLHQGSFYRFKYEVTRLIKCGETNLLQVKVAKHSANRSVNNAERTADYWVFGGIFRPVYLEAMPQEFIERVAINAKADGDFAMEVFVNGVTNAENKLSSLKKPSGPINKSPWPWA